MLGICRQTLWRMVRRGEFPAPLHSLPPPALGGPRTWTPGSTNAPQRSRDPIRADPAGDYPAGSEVLPR